MNAQAIAYAYRAAIHCPLCILKVYGSTRLDMNVERTLDILADQKGIDRHDETMFDSCVFPKVVFRYMLADSENCDTCGKEIA